MSAKKIFIIDPEKCTNCRVCEFVCSFYHNKSFNPRRSRIRVLKDDEKGISISMAYQQCDTPSCQEARPVEAIYRHEATGTCLARAHKPECDVRRVL